MASSAHLFFILSIVCSSNSILETSHQNNQTQHSVIPYRKHFHNPQKFLFKESITGLKNPTNLLVHHDTIYISLFMENKILLGHLSNKQLHGFADGSYCSNKTTGSVVCGTVDGPWGLTAYNSTLFVSSFGSDQILVFSMPDSRFIHAFGNSDTLDCPEGIVIDVSQQIMYIINYASNSIAVYDLHDYKFIRYFATATTIPFLKGPESITIDKSRNLIAVTCYINNSVVFIDSNTGRLSSVVFPDQYQAYAPPSANQQFSVNKTRNNSSPPITGTDTGTGSSMLKNSTALLGPIGLFLTSLGTYMVSYYNVSKLCAKFNENDNDKEGK